MRTDYSRPLLVATNGSSHPPADLLARLEATTVKITADPGQLVCLRTLVANLRRVPVNITFDPAGAELDVDTTESLVDLSARIDPERAIRIGRSSMADLHVHVGTGPTAATIRAVPDGHGVRLRRAGHPFPTIRPATGLGAIYTAAVLTAEIFKEIVDVGPGRHRKRETIDLCPVTLTAPSQTPALPVLDRTALIGGGAIGTAIALILRELSTTGNLAVVDSETFELPNVATYSLGDLGTAAQQLPKVDLLAQNLPGVDVLRYQGTAAEFSAQIDQGRFLAPRWVLGAVDSIEARHEIARLHADWTIDGSTGGGVGTTLALSEATFAGPCLRCYYPPPAPSRDLSAEQLLAQMTGLSLERISRGDAPLSHADLRNLTPDGQRLLASHIGRPVCGLARSLGLIPGAASNPFRPSVAFVAQQAAALVVGSLIARHADPALEPRDVEYDALFGPHPAMVQVRSHRPDCRCQVDADIIRTVRARRARP